MEQVVRSAVKHRGCHVVTRKLAGRPEEGLPLSRRPCCYQSRSSNTGSRNLVTAASSPRREEALSLDAIKELIASQPLEPEQRESLSKVADALDISIGTAKNLVYKRRGLASMSPEDIRSNVQKIADIVGVEYDIARRMAVIQPGLLFDTPKQAETLTMGLRAICYELNAPKEEIVQLILNHPSVLHGRQMHLSVSDIATLAMLREPRGRIVD